MGQINFIRDLIGENWVWEPNLALIENIEIVLNLFFTKSIGLNHG
jgi:hypothetical protein